MFLELTEDNLQQYVADNNKVMVQYAASWCGNCRIMKPKFKKLAAEMQVSLPIQRSLGPWGDKGGSRDT